MFLKCLYVSIYEGKDKNAPDPKNAANTGENTAKTRDKTQRQPAPTASTARPPMIPPTWDRLPSLSFTFSSGSARKDRLLESISNVMNIAGTEYLIKLKNLQTYHPLEPGHQDLRESFAIFAV
jgi:hypothetical protein